MRRRLWFARDVVIARTIKNGVIQSMIQAEFMASRTRFMYSRIAHFRMWLDRLQGLDVIPPHILRRVKSYLGQLPVVQPTAVRMRQVLKEVNASAYTNSIPATLLGSLQQDTTHVTHRVRDCGQNPCFCGSKNAFEDNIKGRHPPEKPPIVLLSLAPDPGRDWCGRSICYTEDIKARR